MAHRQAEERRVYPAPRPLVWAIVADTNRFDRAAGLSAGRYSWKREGIKNFRSAVAKEMLGIEVEWIEPPYSWIEGRFVAGERRFIRGPVNHGGLTVRLRDVDGGTEVHAIAFVDAPFPIDVIQRVKLGRGLTRYFDGIGTMLEQTKAAIGEMDSTSEPAMARARRLLSLGYDLAMSGPVSEVALELLTARAERLRASGYEPELVAKLVTWLRERPDEDVSQIRPFELARVWGADRRDVLRLFLRATEVGLVDLEWQINCPVCRVGSSIVGSLADIADGKTHCGACEIDYAVDFARHVEAVFPCNAAVRRVSPSLYCASSPSFLPHVHTQARLDAGATLEEGADFPIGTLHLRTLWTKHTAELSLSHAPERVTITMTDSSLEVHAEGRATPDNPSRLVVKNETKDEATVLIERTDWSADAVLGTTIASLAEFVRLFATEAPAAGMELVVGHIGLLFSDLTGSTALYERVGDARAFAIVEDHFQMMSAAIEGAGGALVKTMGDAVMAAFPSSREATIAALQMIASHDTKHCDSGLGVKLGVHAGPCLAVRANNRLDYFGTAVNVTARLQAQARPSQVVMTEETAAEVRSLIEGLPQTSFEADLKGIKERQRLIAIDASSLATKHRESA